jgi:hypothetical protein
MADAESRTIPLLGVFAQLLGAWYPKDYVVAAIDGSQGEPAKQALVTAGFGSNVIYLHDSARVLQIGTTIYEQRSPMQRAGAAFARAVTDEGLMAQEYVDEAKRGASVIAVLCSEPRLVAQAQQVLGAHGARRIRYYGATAITDLS